MQQITFRAMGCSLLVALDSEVQTATALLNTVPTWFEAWEQCLSRFRPDSELSQLNRSGGDSPRHVSETLWFVIQAAHQAEAQSTGLVTPLVLPALEAAGYTQSFVALPQTAQGQYPHPPMHHSDAMLPRDKHNQAIPTTLKQALVCNAQNRTIHPAPGVQLDLGGIAKGWAAEQTVARLRKHGPVLVDVGGDIATSGARANGQRWAIAIMNPHQPTAQLELLMLRKGGVATSGRDYRRWQQHGVWQHHLIDPRTGRPAETDILSATVVAPTPCEAEGVAKMMILMGSQAGLAWIEQHPTLAGLLVGEDGTVYRSRRLHQYTW